jgi:arsenate reductase (thioredoxin)
MTTARVLFMCTHNAARSQMAEAFLRLHGGGEFEVFSAGLEPRDVEPAAIAVMAERGIDIGSQRAKGLDEFLGKTHSGFLITLCARAEQECPTFPGMGTRLFWRFADPAVFKGSEEERLEIFRQVRDQIERRIVRWLAESATTAPEARAEAAG